MGFFRYLNRIKDSGSNRGTRLFFPKISKQQLFGGATVTRYSVDNALISSTFVDSSDWYVGYEFTEAGYYTVQFDASDAFTLSFTSWAWGGAGGRGTGPGPAQGGAGHGVRGSYTLPGGSNYDSSCGRRW